MKGKKNKRKIDILEFKYNKYITINPKVIISIIKFKKILYTWEYSKQKLIFLSCSSEVILNEVSNGK